MKSSLSPCHLLSPFPVPFPRTADTPLPQEVRLLEEISSHSREVIARCFLGEYATEHVLEQIDRLYPPMCRGVMSIPLHFPWPLNKIPVLSFGPALAARKEFKDVFDSVLRKLMAHKASGRIVNGGVLDALLVAQELQPNGGTEEDSSSFDDELIFNNVRKGGEVSLLDLLRKPSPVGYPYQSFQSLPLSQFPVIAYIGKMQ